MFVRRGQTDVITIKQINNMRLLVSLYSHFRFNVLILFTVESKKRTSTYLHMDIYRSIVLSIFRIISAIINFIKCVCVNIYLITTSSSVVMMILVRYARYKNNHFNDFLFISIDYFISKHQ